MSKGIKTPIAQTEYIISNIRHEVLTTPIDTDVKLLTWLIDSASNKGKDAINLREFERRLNYLSKNADNVKIKNSGLLTGLYNYFNGPGCHTTAPYLFLDIDVKDRLDKKGKPLQENLHLFNPADNARIFEAVKKIAIATWRSSSGNGIAGILCVPQIAQYTHLTSIYHKRVGEAIYNYLSDYLAREVNDVKRVKFDNEQAKFRQVRLVSHQDTPRHINPHPFVFSYDSELKIKKSKNNVTLYKRTKNKVVYKKADDVIYTLPHKKSDTIQSGTIFEQFDTDNDILEMMFEYGFTEYSRNEKRVYVKHDNSQRNNTGYIDIQEKCYHNFSNTFGGRKEFYPSDILAFFEHGKDYTETKKYLYSIGYEDKPITDDELNSISKAITNDLRHSNPSDIDKVIFKYCDQLTRATNAQKYKFIADNCTNSEHEKYFIEYLQIVDYTINYDAKIVIDIWVSEKLTDILSYADEHKKIILKAETGTGKTTAFTEYLIQLHPDKRILILAPLKMIVDQNRKKYEDEKKYNIDDYVFLTGDDTQSQADKVSKAKVVFATYEQGAKWITHKNHNFNYIIVDEIHNLITANSYKPGVIEKITPLLENNNVIGLTGTPSQEFNLLGYKLLNVIKKTQPITPCEVRYSNTNKYNIALNHLANRPTGKVLMRVNSIDTIKELTDHLVKLKLYRRSEILQLYSTKDIKKSTDYTDLTLEEKFANQYRLILTTSVIDEGISIYQKRFSDVVFIETDYNPRGEAVKQFFARFRNDDQDRKNILYLRKTIDQTPTNFKTETMYQNDMNILLSDIETCNDATDVLTTYNHVFSNNKYLYDNGTVNPYYLTYAVTNVLFQRLNAKQYLEYLESNYNLSFTINEDYQVKKYEADKTTTKENKQQIAKAWIDEKEQIYQAIRAHTQDPEIRKTITLQMVNTDNEVYKIVIENIKEFEKLFKRSSNLAKYGDENPDEILINTDVEPITLHSKTPYNNEILYYSIEKSLTLPTEKQSPGDKKTIKQYTQFATWCEKTGTFTNKQMMRKLKELGILESNRIKESILFRILESFNLDVHRNTKTHLIYCKKRYY